MRITSTVPVLAAAFTLAACGSSSEPRDTTPASIAPVGSSSFSLIARQSTAVTVRVTNVGAQPLAGVAVSFDPEAGTVSSGSVPTGADGTATTQWTTGATAGQQLLRASVANKTIVATFAATVTIQVAGTWVGSVGTQTLTLVIVENAGVVSGSGTLTNTPSGTRALVVNGTYAGSTLTVTLTSGSLQPFNLQAAVQSTTRMSGTLNGSGFTGEAIVLEKL